MAKDDESNSINLAVVGLVALVAIVGLVVLVLNARGVADASQSYGVELVSADDGLYDDSDPAADPNLVGQKTKRCTGSGCPIQR